MSHLEPLAEALRVQQAAAELGFDWREVAELWDKLAEEIGELQEAVPQGHDRTEDELGDLLFMAVNLARHLRVDPAAALVRATGKFNSRFAHVLKHVESLPPMGDARRLEAMEALWQAAKNAQRARD